MKLIDNETVNISFENQLINKNRSLINAKILDSLKETSEITDNRSVYY